MDVGVNTAITSLAVNLTAGLLLYILYLNYLLLKPFLLALFWGAAISIPLHTVKKSILADLVFLRDKEFVFLQSLYTFTRQGLEIFFGPVWDIFYTLFSIYDNFLTNTIGPIKETILHSPHSIVQETTQPDIIMEPIQSCIDDTDSNSDVDLDSLALENASITDSNTSQTDLQEELTLPSTLERTQSILAPIETLSRKWKTLLFSLPLTPTIAKPNTIDSNSPTPFKLTKKVIRHTKKGKARISSNAYLSLVTLWCLRYLLSRYLVTSSTHFSTILFEIFGKVVLMHTIYRVLQAMLFKSHKTISLPSSVVKACAWINGILSGMLLRIRGNVERNLNGIVTNAVIYIVGIGSLLALIFLTSMMIQEGTLAFEGGLRMLNETILTNQDLRGKAETVLFDLQGKVVEYADGYLQGVFPGKSVSSIEIFGQVRESFGYLTSTVIGNPEFDINLNATELNESLVEYGKGVFSVLPVTSLLINKISLRNFTSAQVLFNGASNELARFYTSFHEDAGSNLTLFTPDFLSKASNFSFRATFMTVESLVGVVVFLIQFVMSTFDLLSKFVVFWIVLGACVGCNDGVLGNFGKLFRVIDRKGEVGGVLEHVVENILFTHVKRMVFHFLFGWITFSFIGAHFVYLPAALMGILAVVPMIDCAYVSFYGAISLYLMDGVVWANLALGAAFVVSHFYVSSVVDDAMIDFGEGGQGGLSGMLVGMSFLLGVDVFGFPEGLLVGPFVISSIPIVFRGIAESGRS